MSKSKVFAPQGGKAVNRKVVKASAESPDQGATPDVRKLWKTIQENHEQYEKSRGEMAATIRIGVMHALENGQLLTTAKLQSKHGEFASTVAANCTLSMRQVQRYMQLFNSQATLNKIDKDWMQHFTLVEALEAVREYEVNQSATAVDEQRSSGLEPQAKASKATSRPTAKVAARSNRDVVRAPTTSAVKSAFKAAQQELGTFHKSIEVIKKAETLKIIEDEAARIVEECQTLIAECKQQRQSLEGPPKKAASSKAADPDWGSTGAVSKMAPTAKHAAGTSKNRRSTVKETDPSKA